jgi:hypothetical protein
MSDTAPGEAEKAPEIPDQVARHVLWHFGDLALGQQPGDFTQRLLGAMAHADLTNFAKLATAFPDYAFAFNAVSRTHWGMTWLRNRVLDAQVHA